MVASNSRSGPTIRFQPDEKPPNSLTAFLGLQLAILCVPGPVLVPALVMQSAGGAEAHLVWAVFASVVACGATTALQAIRYGRIGAGHVLAMGASGAYIAVCVTAVAQGGAALMGTLIISAALFQIAISTRLALFRKILTPTVSGTVIMLIPVTVMPIVFDLLGDIPAEAAAHAAPLSAAATLLAVVAIALKSSGVLRLWALVIGVFVGSGVSAVLGLYDAGRVAEAALLGFPQGEWPGLDFSFDPVYWSLLPAFLFVTLVSTMQVIGGSIAIQRVSWRGRRSIDFRAVQGAATTAGIGNLLCGVSGSVPLSAYPTSISMTELTGVAARRVGIALGAIFGALALSPKALAVILAVPNPVVAAYLTVLLASLFLLGMKMVVTDGLDYRKGLIVGVAFWLGVGFQSGEIFPQFVSEFAYGLFQNGMMAGGSAAILMTLFVELRHTLRRRIELELDVSAISAIREFLGDFVARNGWGPAMAHRLEAASEETLLTLLDRDKGDSTSSQRRLSLSAHRQGGAAVLDFMAAPGGENMQDRIAMLSTHTEESFRETDVSLRLLRHLASSVRHQQFHDTDIVTLRVENRE